MFCQQTGSRNDVEKFFYSATDLCKLQFNCLPIPNFAFNDSDSPHFSELMNKKSWRGGGLRGKEEKETFPGRVMQIQGSNKKNSQKERQTCRQTRIPNLTRRPSLWDEKTQEVLPSYLPFFPYRLLFDLHCATLLFSDLFRNLMALKNFVLYWLASTYTSAFHLQGY